MCSYCGCQAIGVIGRFMSEHVDVVNELTELRAACQTGDGERARAAAEVVAGSFDPHTHAEEVGLFTVMGEDPEFTEHIATLCSEHTHLDDLLARIAGGEHTAYDEFEHALRHHIDKEDNGLFPAAAIALSGPDWERVDALTPPAQSETLGA